jgi:hypothetical protein
VDRNIPLECVYHYEATWKRLSTYYLEDVILSEAKNLTTKCPAPQWRWRYSREVWLRSGSLIAEK